MIGDMRLQPFFHRANFGTFRTRSHAATPGTPASRSFLLTLSCISCAEMSGNVNVPASKQWEQYIRFLEPSAFVPPPFSSRRMGIPQDWQSLYDFAVLITLAPPFCMIAHCIQQCVYLQS